MESNKERILYLDKNNQIQNDKYDRLHESYRTLKLFETINNHSSQY